MKTLSAVLVACAMTIPSVASATALTDAVAADVCSVSAAQYLPGGRLQITCVKGTVKAGLASSATPVAAAGAAGAVTTPGVLAGAGLGAGAIGAIAASVLVIGIAVGSDGTTTTTTANP